MLHNVNIISTSVSEAVEEIPTDEKDYRKCSFMCFTLHSFIIQGATLYSHSIAKKSSVAKKTIEDILHKIYTEKGPITGI